MARRECPTPEKKPYATKAQAANIRNVVAGELRIYRCECGKWHFTSKRGDRIGKIHPDLEDHHGRRGHPRQ